jgi:hypothetical protein
VLSAGLLGEISGSDGGEFVTPCSLGEIYRRFIGVFLSPSSGHIGSSHL